MYSPWYVVPADHKWYARLVISRIVLNELKDMNPNWPVLDKEEMAKMSSYREKLAAETSVLEDDSNEDDGGKVKPTDVVIDNAIRADFEALTEKAIKDFNKKNKKK